MNSLLYTYSCLVKNYWMVFQSSRSQTHTNEPKNFDQCGKTFIARCDLLYTLFDHDDDGDDLDDLDDDAGNRSRPRWTIIMIMYACLARSRAFTLAFLICLRLLS
uniref:Uncharacterized protein n=1 Tax=Trichogramma kaykai TaxID=54128 RepID=A0ABD2X4T4_9HYME